MRTSNYDRYPTVQVRTASDSACSGWASVAARLKEAVTAQLASQTAPVLVIECYAGVFADEIRRELRNCFSAALWLDPADALRPSAEIERQIAPDLGGDDRVFGYLTRLTLEDFFQPEILTSLRDKAARASTPVVIVGTGASLVAPSPAVMVYADLPRWEAQQRQRRNEISSLGAQNLLQHPSLKYKRAFFVDWRVCDRVKQRTLARWDFLLDTSIPNLPKLVIGDAFRDALEQCTVRPFRVVPFFDPGPWGGQWMRAVCGLDPGPPNYAWCFDCVPEENSLLLQFGPVRVEIPAMDVVLAQPRPLLGEPVYGRFGPEFPIRFDFLDTMDGGNLSLQVHPVTQYIQEHFGMRYTQDESYYILDAKPGAEVYLGRRPGAQFEEFVQELESAQLGVRPFDDNKFVARFPARKHDHFLIPAGTLHCSGRNSMVLEISATPYIFTFKLWDWNRMGLDGRPRPINIGHGKQNICWDRDEDYAKERLINQVREVARGDGWREERTGLHEATFIETRRHWFSGAAPHDTGGERNGSVNVLNLVEGEEAVVESPENAFAPFIVHYAETFIIPAAAGRYRIRPTGRALGTECVTIKAAVRCSY